MFNSTKALSAIALIGVLTLLGAPGARASSILFQSVPDLSATPTDFYCSTCNTFFNQREYDTFTLGAAATLSSVTFNIENDSDASIPASLQIGFFQLSGGMPGASLGSFTATPSSFTSEVDTVFGDREVSTVTVPISLALAAGTYDISFYSALGLGVTAYSGGSGMLAETEPSFPGPAFLTHPGESLGFELNGNLAATPLPASWSMMLIGVAGLGLMFYRGRRENGARLAA